MVNSPHDSVLSPTPCVNESPIETIRVGFDLESIIGVGIGSKFGQIIAYRNLFASLLNCGVSRLECSFSLV